MPCFKWSNDDMMFSCTTSNNSTIRMILLLLNNSSIIISVSSVPCTHQSELLIWSLPYHNIRLSCSQICKTAEPDNEKEVPYLYDNYYSVMRLNDYYYESKRGILLSRSGRE